MGVCPSCGKGKLVVIGKKGKSKCDTCMYIHRTQVMRKPVKKGK